MPTAFSRKVLLPLCIVSALAGCGGGGSDTPRPPPNAAPVLTSTTFAATEDTAFAGQLTATDAENQAITFARTTDAQHGQVTISATGAVAYTPAANYAGADTFGVRLTDSAGGTSTGTVTLNVAAVNDVPVFASPTLGTPEDVALDAQLTAYVTDPDANPLTFAVTTAPAHGVLTLSAGGTAAFTPAANYNGADSFAISVSDGAGGIATGTVTINITAVNDVPVLTTTQLSIAEDGVLTAQLATTDVENQVTQYQVGGGAGHGQVSISPTGFLTYTPDANFNGADSLLVGVSDDGATLTLWPLDITVSPVNDAPVAYEDLLRLPANATVTLPVLANDSDADGDTLTVTLLSQPGGGTLTVNASNEITFTRDNQFNGPIRFSYRITDAAGVTAEADVRAVIGEFPGIYYLADETTVGQLEVHWFDGLRIYRLGTDLDAGDVISSFATAGDGDTVAYVVDSDTVSRVFFTGPTAQDSRVVFTSGAKPPGSPNHLFIKVNRNGTYLLVVDPFAAGGIASYMVRTSDGLQTRIAANTPEIVQLPSVVFSPANDDFYVNAQVGGSLPPMSSTGYKTLYRGNTASAGTLTRVGAAYPAVTDGNGSGLGVTLTPDGRYAVHAESLYNGGPKTSMLVYDSVAGAESLMYRRPVTNEYGVSGEFTLSPDGSRVCFMFPEAGASSSAGPARFIAGSPASPASAAPVTPVFNFGFQCRFGSDNRSMYYLAGTAAEPRMQVYSVDAGAPGTPLAVNRPLVTGEEIDAWWVARNAPRLAFFTRGSGGQMDFYSASPDAPGTFIPFATNVFDDRSMPGSLDGSGYLLAYSKRPAPLTGLRRLTLLSTQSASYSFSLMRANTSTGLQQFEWAP